MYGSGQLSYSKKQAVTHSNHGTKKERLQAVTAVAIVGLALLGLAVAAGFVRYEHTRMNDQLASQQNQIERLEQSVAELTQEAQSRQPHPQKEAALTRVNDTLARRQKLLAQVEGLISADTTGFADPLAALARQVPAGLWLTRIRLNAQNGNVGLDGRAQAGKLVPSYLEALGEEPAFQGKTFGAFRLERSEQGGGIEFRVATDASAGGEP
jgi:MSHA biogenesis protein MshI